uniref:Protein FAM228B n=1 Tax=Oncorhynchus mykiss TaxID=8022 RepID=A0A8L0DJZ4_ONCMY
QVKLESENQEARAITQPLLDTENGFVKDLERYLCQQERAELRKRELLHKRWTERVWTPIQRSVENQVPHCCYDEAERIRSMFLNYIHYCNSKVQHTCASILPEYVNWFHFFQVATPASRDPLFLQSRDGTKEKRAVLHCQTGIVAKTTKTRPGTLGTNSKRKGTINPRCDCYLFKGVSQV